MTLAGTPTAVASGGISLVTTAPAKVQQICDTTKSVNQDIIVLCHGGPISTPEDAEYVLQNTNGVNGFYGASSMERLPTEIAIAEQMKRFKAIRFE